MRRSSNVIIRLALLVAIGLLPYPALAQQSTCLCTIWSLSTVPTLLDQGPDDPMELGVRFRSDVPGVVIGVRFYKSINNLGPHTGSLWDNSGNLLATATFSSETASGWQQVTFSNPVSINANTVYVASYHTSAGHESMDAYSFSSSGVDSPPLHALSDWEDGANGAYAYGDTATFPNNSYESSNFWVDVIFEPSIPKTPVQISVTPDAPMVQAGAMQQFTATATYDDNTTQDITTVVTWSTSNPGIAIVNSAGIAQGVGAGNATISASYQGLSGGADLIVQPLAQFCPCSLWAPSAIPGMVDQGPDDPLELGVKFRSDVDGFITAIRFYKSPHNGGPHVGSLWDANGNLLATATFSNETNLGWQQVNFSNPVPITANAIYVASYHTNAGHESMDEWYFGSQATDTPPLHALWNGTNGANGVYSYSATSTFPTTPYDGSNFWVDVVFETTPPPVPLSITVSPANPIVQVGTAQQMTAMATYSDNSAHDISAVTSWTSSDPNLATVSSAGSVQAMGPGFVTISAKYGNITGSTTIEIHTLSNSLCPCSIWSSTAMPSVPDSGDGSANESGVKFRSDINGLITGIRFYKSTNNTGTHVGNLWTTDGQLLARATFENETDSGWQQVNFAEPVQITANNVYVASYHTDVGHETQDWGYFSQFGVDNPPLHALANGEDGGNGVCVDSDTTVFPDCSSGGTNFWVDVVFVPSVQANQAPVVNAGPDQSITLPVNSLTLAGSATDDGLPNGTLSLAWSVSSGPGSVSFSNPNSAVTDASFPSAGTYVLTLSANDGQLQSSATTTVIVNPAPYPAPTVSAGPDQTITLPANMVNLNGSATDQGLPITTSWTMVSGPAPVLFGNALNPVSTAMFTVAGIYDLRLTATNGQTSAFADASITVNPQANTPISAAIVLSPASAGPILTGAIQQMHAQITDDTGAPIVNQPVTFTVTGPNSTAGTGTTDGSGVATFNYSGTSGGVDAIVATATLGALSLTSNTSMISWVGASPSVTTSAVQGQFFTSDGSGTFDTLANAQPAFTQTFASINFNPPAGTIVGMPSTIDVTTVPFTNVTTDANGNYTGTVVAQGNGLQAGAGTLSAFQAVFTGTFTVSAAGNVTFRFLNSDGFVFGIGNHAARVGGSYVYPPAATAFHGYSVMGSFNTVTMPAWNTVTVNFPSAGSYPFEIDYTDSNQASLIPPASVWKYKVANAVFGVITSIARNNGVVTVTVNAALDNLTAGSTVAIGDVTDLGNFPNSIQTVSKVTQIYEGSKYFNPSTTFTVNWAGNNVSSSGGTVNQQFNQPFYLIGFDDSSFSLGQAPFTDTVGGQGSVGCPLIGKTLFPVLGTIDLRKMVELPAGATNVKAQVAIDNDFTLWVNGTEIINQDHENCAFYWEYTVPIPDNLLHAGTNLIAVQARDRGVNTAFDLSLTGPASLVSAKPLTLVMSTNGNSGQSLISLSPSASQNQFLGQPAVFTALITDRSGTPLGSIPVTFNVAGSNAQQTTILSDAGGTAVFTYTGFFAGSDIVQASATIADSPLVSTQTQVTWGYQTNLPNDGTLVLSPSSPQTPTIGQSQTFTVTARDGSGNPVPNVPVTLLISIANMKQLTSTTDSSGVASFSYGSTVAGTDTVEANAIINGTAAFSNLTTVAWKGSPQTTTYVFTPQGWIASPTIGTVVQNQVPIVLASGVTLTSGTLKYFPSANPSNVTVLNTNTVGAGPLTLGTFDATLLANGEYTVQLQAISSTGAAQLNEIVLSVTGEYKPGRVVYSVTDFKVPLAGIPINITRTYDSLNRANVSDFGNGWSLSTSVNLQVDRLMNVTFTFNGKSLTFYFTPQSTGQALFPWLLQPKYTPQPGVHGTLTSDGCGILIYTGGSLVQDSSGIVCFPAGTYQPTIYTYTDPMGRVYRMSSNGTLQTVKDLNGNLLSFSSTGITSSAGSGSVAVPFVRDAQNRITQITDLNGNTYSYSYDASCGTGNLCSVTFPGTADVKNTYTYFADHSLNTRSDPNGNATVYTYYGDGRMQSVQEPSVPGLNGSSTQYLSQYAYDVSTNTTTTTNPDGGIIVQSDNSFGRPVTIIDALGHTTTYTYDTSQNLVAQTDAIGNVTKYGYDTNGNQTLLTDPLGNSSTRSYNQYGQVTSETDATKQNTRSFAYDANFNLKQVTDSVGQVYAATYDAGGNPVTQTDANGNVSQFSYDASGNLLKLVDPLNATTTFTYDGMGRMLTRTDPRGGKTTNAYDALGTLTSITDPLNHITKRTYDLSGNKISETDALNRTTSFAYDALNRLSTVTYPDNTAKSYVYDFRNNKLSETDQAGHTTQYQYDLAGELKSITRGLGTEDAGTVQYGYYANGLQQTQTDELGNVTTYVYDAAGRLTSVEDAIHNTTKYGYDADGRRIRKTDGRQNTTAYVFDARGRNTGVTYPDMTSEGYAYDGVGNRLSKTDQGGNTTKWKYDQDNRLSSVTDPLQNATAYGYDLSGNLTSITDANGRATSFQYDSLNRKILRGLPLGMVETFSYDAVGNLSTHTDFNGKTTTFTYDLLNRRLTKIPDSSLNEPTITFTYNLTGTRQTMADASGTTQYFYDNRDRVKTKTTPEGTLNYTYDAHGNLLTIVSSNTNGASVTYVPDQLNRLSTVTDNRLAAQGVGSPVTTYVYDSAGNLSGYVYSANLVQSAHSYDALNRLSQVAWKRGTTSLSSFSYTPYPAGNVHTVAELNGRSVTYGYDPAYRLLTEAIASDPAGNNGTEGYTYDGVGNRQTVSSTIPSLSGSNSYSYDANDRLTTEAYDANGNTTSSGGISSTYDFEDRMLTRGGVALVYDGDGNRVSETIGSTTTKYLVDDKNPTGLPQVLDEIVNGSVTRTYAYGRQRISENQVVGSTWTPSFYGYDGHGNARFLTNSAGTITDTYTFDAFGAQIASTGTTPNPYLYSGERFDSSLNLYHLRARYYNMLTGRFMTMDQAVEHKSCCGSGSCSGQWSNLYVYADDDPANRIDPSGRASAAVEYVVDLTPLIIATPAIIYFSISAKCNEELIRCELTALNDLPGSVWGAGRCLWCHEACIRNGYWPSRAPGIRGSVRCDYWNYPSTE